MCECVCAHAAEASRRYPLSSSTSVLFASLRQSLAAHEACVLSLGWQPASTNDRPLCSRNCIPHCCTPAFYIIIPAQQPCTSTPDCWAFFQPCDMLSILMNRVDFPAQDQCPTPLRWALSPTLKSEWTLDTISQTEGGHPLVTSCHAIVPWFPPFYLAFLHFWSPRFFTSLFSSDFSTMPNIP